jgi:hypothetical protein
MSDPIVIHPIRIAAAPVPAPAGIAFLCGEEEMEATFGQFPRLMKNPPQLRDWNVLPGVFER